MIDDEVSCQGALFGGCVLLCEPSFLSANDLKIKPYKNAFLCSGGFPCAKWFHPMPLSVT